LKLFAALFGWATDAKTATGNLIETFAEEFIPEWFPLSSYSPLITENSSIHF